MGTSVICKVNSFLLIFNPVFEKGEEMSRTVDQKIAEAEAKLQRLKVQKKANATRRKIIVGSIVITEGLNSPRFAKWLAETLRKRATREVDQKEIADLLAQLDSKASEQAGPDNER